MNLQSIQYRGLVQGENGFGWVWRQNTFPAESRPSISMRTSWSLLHRTRDDSDEKRVDIERPMADYREIRD
jgi:hypothetical protein